MSWSYSSNHWLLSLRAGSCIKCAEPSASVNLIFLPMWLNGKLTLNLRSLLIAWNCSKQQEEETNENDLNTRKELQGKRDYYHTG